VILAPDRLKEMKITFIEKWGCGAFLVGWIKLILTDSTE
jgi:hypothetical protein